MHEEHTRHIAEGFVRTLATALRTLRLYPPSSPIPQQSASLAAEALSLALSDVEAVTIRPERDGLICLGIPTSAPGAKDVSELLVAHGIAEVSFARGTTADHLAIFASLLLEDPDASPRNGGIAAALSAAGIGTIRTSDVVLIAAGATAPASAPDLDAFLRELAADPGRLAAWLHGASPGNAADVADGLREMLRATAGDASALAASLEDAFADLPQDARDALLTVAAKETDLMAMFASVLGRIRPTDIAASITGGMYGANALSISGILAGLPLGERLRDVLAEVGPLLKARGRTDRELAFLEHMLDVRTSGTPEPSLVERRPDYQRVAQAAAVGETEVAMAQEGIRAAASSLNARSVTMLLRLLDQQQDYELYCKTLDSVASTVPTLLQMHDVALAERVVKELTVRASRATHPWPGLGDRITSAIQAATGPASARALFFAVIDDPQLVGKAHTLLTQGGIAAQAAFVEEALRAPGVDGLGFAERVLGRRLLDVAAHLVATIPWNHAGPLAQWLAASDDPRATFVLDRLAAHSEARTRQEVARALGDARLAHWCPCLERLVRDESPDVALTAIRALGRSLAPGAVGVLSARFEELDCDGKDFPVCREIIGALARSPDPEADRVLERIASRRALIKRGHFAEVVEAAREALRVRAEGSTGR